MPARKKINLEKVNARHSLRPARSADTRFHRQNCAESVRPKCVAQNAESLLKMCLWYGMNYVVVEGWRDAKLSDGEVDRLLASPNTELLRLFRNGMVHFQTDHWLPTKFSGFFEPKNKTVEWVRSLTTELRRSLLAEMKKISAKP